MAKVLGIVYRTLATHITKKAGYNKQTDSKNGYSISYCIATGSQQGRKLFYEVSTYFRCEEKGVYSTYTLSLLTLTNIFPNKSNSLVTDFKRLILQ